MSTKLTDDEAAAVAWRVNVLKSRETFGLA
jgi:hypothetical protein